MGAREQLAASHAQMTPAEIAVHALDLAELVEAYHARIRSLEAAVEAAHASAESSRKGWLTARSRVTEAQSLYDQHRKREARAILAALAVPLELPPLPDLALVGRVADLADEVFKPHG
ncbi:hypothetical protein EN844_06540 [Mesorhizobium sp. M3A.F.Ca.ET.201.01.1.1]|uniref:hypothetical protein n=1 Tax=Mesorhizobium sp. M3A.F.Ca.ET.201.01.1.1 TaxID=2563946 RepID=UPI0010934939|nr:hypothetical protein [Mesorhizobium sp. M3A.F.Ca.ET.201.01.1.1]TGS70394.1 hypothetical protein EN844_06540 [Mesorhizobium sp. M3A.F.Ca.ET.201.01.1.1]